MLFLSADPAVAQGDGDTLRMQIGNTSGFVGQLVSIPIYLSAEIGDEDSCGGFDISLALNRPDLMYFEVDTVIDTDTSYVCQFDTVGTLASGWDMVNARSVIGKGLELQLMGISDYMEQGDHALPPNTSGVLLKIFGRILTNIPDTLSDRIVYVDPNTCYYSNTRGELIEPSKNTSGWVAVESYERGDVNCDNGINPLDVVFIVNKVYRGWNVLCDDSLGDVDCSGMLTPLDVTYMVNYVFKYWPFYGC
jgi:hypothetical protein